MRASISMSARGVAGCCDRARATAACSARMAASRVPPFSSGGSALLLLLAGPAAANLRRQRARMDADYLWLKVLHIFLAVVALGTSAGLGVVLEFYGNDTAHGAFVLRIVERMVALVVLPGYVLVLATGLWMASLAWPFTARWIQWALGLWVLGSAFLGCSLAALRKQRRLPGAGGHAYARYAFASRASGAAFGLVVVAILCLMVFKP